MQLLLLLSLAVTASAFYDEPPDNCKNKNSCDTTDYVKKIQCLGSSETNTCDCYKDQDTKCDIFDETTTSQMTLQKCKDLCIPDDSDKCFFYRWEKAGYSKDITCFLMNKDQCTEKGPEPCENSLHCESGDIEEKCQGSGDDVRPDGNPCDVKLPKSDPLLMQWYCFDPYAKKGEKKLDVYTVTPDAVTVPHEAICETVDMCINFATGEAKDEGYPTFLKYTCRAGSWVAGSHINAPTDDDSVVNGKVLNKEPACNPEPLNVLKAQLGKGEELICSNPKVLVDPNWVITAPSTCALLCDKHHVVTVQSGFTDAKGTVGWNLYVVGHAEDPKITDGTDVNCWDD